MSVAQKASAAVGKVSSAVAGTKLSVKELLANGGWRVIHDGNLMQTLLVKSRSANLVGEDTHGNRYFENLNEPQGQHRWVVFANNYKKTGLDPSTVTPEWHGWLHFSTDQMPSREPFTQPVYAVEPRGNRTGNLALRYLPKGSWSNPDRRHWQKYTAWSPGSTAGKPVP